MRDGDPGDKHENEVDDKIGNDLALDEKVQEVSACENSPPKDLTDPINPVSSCRVHCLLH